MGFKKRQPAKKQQRQSREPDGKISLWTPRKDAKYVISGIVTIGDEKFRVFIYENDDPLHDNSPEYYGSLYLDDEESEPRGKKSKTLTTKKVEEEDDEDDEIDTDELPY